MTDLSQQMQNVHYCRIIDYEDIKKQLIQYQIEKLKDVTLLTKLLTTGEFRDLMVINDATDKIELCKFFIECGLHLEYMRGFTQLDEFVDVKFILVKLDNDFNYYCIYNYFEDEKFHDI